MAVCKWYLLNIRCFLSCVQIFEHFLNTLRPHFCVALCHLAVGAKIALKRGKKNCKPLFRDLHFLCELFRSRIIKFYVIWLKNVVFRLFAHSFRPRPPFNPIFSFSLKTHSGCKKCSDERQNCYVYLPVRPEGQLGKCYVQRNSASLVPPYTGCSSMRISCFSHR